MPNGFYLLFLIKAIIFLRYYFLNLGDTGMFFKKIAKIACIVNKILNYCCKNKLFMLY